MNFIHLFRRDLRGGSQDSSLVDPSVAPVEPPQATDREIVAPRSATVVALHPDTHPMFGLPNMPSPEVGGIAEQDTPRAGSSKPAGLLATPEMQAVLGRDHYASGRHHGCVYRSVEALEQGLETIVTSFQNEAAALAERRHARMDSLLLERQQIAGLGQGLIDTLQLAAEQLRREIAVLNKQIELAGTRKGWVLDALNRYQLGFDRGVREAINFRLLGS
jgi:hypothetical protein